MVRSLALAALFGALIQLTGCASAFSRETLQLISPDISLHDVHDNPGRYLGRVIPVAGPILRTWNRPDGTLLEILAYPTTNRGFPDTGEPAAGHFALLYPGYLDSLVYRPGRWIAAAGRVVGQLPSPNSETVHPPPLIRPLELELMPERPLYSPFHIGVGFMFGF